MVLIWELMKKVRMIMNSPTTFNFIVWFLLFLTVKHKHSVVFIIGYINDDDHTLHVLSSNFFTHN